MMPLLILLLQDFACGPNLGQWQICYDDSSCCICFVYQGFIHRFGDRKGGNEVVMTMLIFVQE
jgi:hypothetical protein